MCNFDWYQMFSITWVAFKLYKNLEFLNRLKIFQFKKKILISCAIQSERSQINLYKNKQKRCVIIGYLKFQRYFKPVF